MLAKFNRRKFIAASSAAVAAGLSQSGFLFGQEKGKAEDERLFDISLAEWSLHRTLRKKEINNLDFPKVAKEEFGIEAIEYVNQFFKDKAEDEKYLADLKKRCEDVGVTSLLIMCDGEGSLGDPDDGKRTKAVENHYKWISAAKFLGCHSIRVNADARGKGTREEQAKRAADGLARLTEFGDKHKINVIVENHGGLSSDGKWLADVISKVDMERCGTLPDFGNFRTGKKDGKDVWYDRYQGVEELMPFAKAVSAKSHSFDENGQEKDTDFMKMMKIVLDAGFRGFVGIEWEGGKPDEYEGIKMTKKLLEKCHEELLPIYVKKAEEEKAKGAAKGAKKKAGE